jgi:hypothetical protein
MESKEELVLSIQSKAAPFGRGVWGLVLALIVAAVLVGAYVDGPRSLPRGAFAVGALAILGRHILTFRYRKSFGRGTAG